MVSRVRSFEFSKSFPWSAQNISSPPWPFNVTGTPAFRVSRATAADCASADAWATALLVAGAAEGLALAQREALEVLFLLRRQGRWVELGLGRVITQHRRQSAARQSPTRAEQSPAAGWWWQAPP